MDPTPTHIYTLSLHDALPISQREAWPGQLRIVDGARERRSNPLATGGRRELRGGHPDIVPDRKSTRLNSSHVAISYAVFCLKKKRQYSSHILNINYQ